MSRFTVWTLAVSVGLFIMGGVGWRPSASAVACSTEQQKFVGSSNDAYGAMGTMYVFNRGMEKCASVANTVFVYLSIQSFGYVEAGTRQFGSTGGGTFKTFFEYADYPASAVYVEGTSTFASGQNITFAVTPNSNGSWKGQYNFSGNEAGPWTTIGTSSIMISDHGSPQSEISRYGDASARGSNSALKYRPGSGWTYWTNLGCSIYFPNSIMDYDAMKQNDRWWTSEAGTPPAGDC